MNLERNYWNKGRDNCNTVVSDNDGRRQLKTHSKLINLTKTLFRLFNRKKGLKLSTTNVSSILIKGKMSTPLNLYNSLNRSHSLQKRPSES